MAIKLLTSLTQLTFSRLEQPKNEKTISTNLLRASLKLTCDTGVLALISFVFNRYLPSNSPWTPLCQPLTSYLVASSGTVLTIAAYMAYSIFRRKQTPAWELNKRVSTLETGWTLIGIVGIVALKTDFLKVDQKISNLVFSTFLGFSTMGFFYKFIHHLQNNQRSKANLKK